MAVSETATYRVPAMHCGNCERAVRAEVSTVAGVDAVEVDLEAKAVTVFGDALDDVAIRAAIEESGYQAA